MPTQEEIETNERRGAERRIQTFVSSGGQVESRVFDPGSRVNKTDSSWGGEVRGAIFDVSTNTYTPTRENQQDISETSKDRGVDSFSVPTDNSQSASNTFVGVVNENGILKTATITGEIGDAI